MLCAGFVVKTVEKYIEKKNVRLSCVCLPEHLPSTPHGDASAVTLSGCCLHYGDAGEEQGTWGRVRL